jgi:hypothetical protein
MDNNLKVRCIWATIIEWLDYNLNPDKGNHIYHQWSIPWKRGYIDDLESFVKAQFGYSLGNMTLSKVDGARVQMLRVMEPHNLRVKVAVIVDLKEQEIMVMWANDIDDRMMTMKKKWHITL